MWPAVILAYLADSNFGLFGQQTFWPIWLVGILAYLATRHFGQLGGQLFWPMWPVNELCIVIGDILIMW